jgi:hypothetical protein
MIVEGVHARIAQEMYHPPVRSVEWTCQHCGGSGHGFLPEVHSSGACAEALKTRIRPYRMIPEVAREAQHSVVAIIHGATHFMDGGGI